MTTKMVFLSKMLSPKDKLGVESAKKKADVFLMDPLRWDLKGIFSLIGS